MGVVWAECMESCILQQCYLFFLFLYLERTCPCLCVCVTACVRLRLRSLILYYQLVHKLCFHFYDAYNLFKEFQIVFCLSMRCAKCQANSCFFVQSSVRDCNLICLKINLFKLNAHIKSYILNTCSILYTATNTCLLN